MGFGYCIRCFCMRLGDLWRMIANVIPGKIQMFSSFSEDKRHNISIKSVWHKVLTRFSLRLPVSKIRTTHHRPIDNIQAGNSWISRFAIAIEALSSTPAMVFRRSTISTFHTNHSKIKPYQTQRSSPSAQRSQVPQVSRNSPQSPQLRLFHSDMFCNRHEQTKPSVIMSVISSFSSYWLVEAQIHIYYILQYIYSISQWVSSKSPINIIYTTWIHVVLASHLLQNQLLKNW